MTDDKTKRIRQRIHKAQVTYLTSMVRLTSANNTQALKITSVQLLPANTKEWVPTESQRTSKVNSCVPQDLVLDGNRLLLHVFDTGNIRYETIDTVDLDINVLDFIIKHI